MLAKSTSYNFALLFTYKSRVVKQGSRRVIYHANMTALIMLNSTTNDEESRQIIYEKTIEERIINFDDSFD